ncbi:MAG: hypothetical protein OHK0045_04560 [Raineya sp.]
MKHYLSQQYRNAVCKYKKFKARFEKNLEQGVSLKKRRTLAQRLNKLREQILRLEAQLKWAVSAGALSLVMAATPTADTIAQNKFAYAPRDLKLAPLGFVQTDAPVYPTFADLDEDGDLDLVLGLSGGGVLYYQRNQDENTGKDVFTLIPNSRFDNPFLGVNELNNYGYLSPSFADMDGDGDLDMIVGYGYNKYGYVTLFKNVDGTFVPFTGTANPFISVQTYGFSGGGGARAEMIDIGDDGDLDLFVSGNNEDKYEIIVRYYENEETNSGAFAQRTGVENPLDIVSIDNTMTGSPYAAYGALTFADVDDDGDLDAYVGEKYGSVFEYKNDGTNTFTDDGRRNDLSFPFYYRAITPAFNDLDNDGDLDCLYGEKYLQTLPFAINDGSNSFTITNDVNTATDFSFSQPNVIETYVLSSTAHLDYDNDDDLDFITFDLYGDIRYFQNNGDLEFEELIGPLNPFNAISGDIDFYIARPVMVDWDNDGDSDLVAGNYYGNIIYFRNDAGTFNKQTGTNNPFNGIDVGSAAVPQLVDWDGDGDLDLFVGERLSMQLWLNNAGTFVQQTGTSDPFAGFTVTSNAYYAPKLVDIDGDGDLDLTFGVIAATSLNFDITKLQYYVNNGENVFSVSTNPTFEPVTVARVATPDFFDVDGDGDDDLLVGENAGAARVQYFERVGNNFCPKIDEIRLEIDANEVYKFRKEEFQEVYNDEPDTKSKDFPKIKILAAPSFGTLRVGGSVVNTGAEIPFASLDRLTYTPNQGYTGIDAFAWAAFDPLGKCYSNGSYVRFGIGTQVTGLDELSQLVGIYPNPSKGLFNINLDKGLVGKVDIQVYNALGSVVKSYNYNTPDEVEAIDLQAMPKGLYIVRISNQGKQGTIKIVKE